MREVSTELQAKLDALPTTPGVYRWKDRFGKIIYVGKAVNLRNRVRSYVRNDVRQSAKVTAMMNHAVDVDIILTKTEMEALILECNLIKELHPKYNILLRDDKTYPYLKITLQEEYPRVFLTRRLQRDGARYLGPYTDVGAVSRTLKTIRGLYPLRTCRSMKVRRPCLQYHLRRCQAPCMGWVPQQEYYAMAEEVAGIFAGKNTALLKDWTRRMEIAAEEMKFEEAAQWRDRLAALRSVQERQHIVAGEGQMDVIGLARQDTKVGVVVLLVRDGKLVGKENFMVTGTEGQSETEVLSGFMKTYYVDGAERIPREVVVAELPDEAVLLMDWLSELRGSQVKILVPERGFKRSLKDMAHENAEKYLADRELQWQHRLAKEEGALRELAGVLDLPNIPERIECFDISHIQGAETVAGMTVLIDGRPANKEYRRFKLKTVQGKPDDFGSMREIMARRYGNHPEWPLPDLIVIDGGKGQLNAALPVVRECGVQVPVIGLAKRLEEIFVEGEKESIQLDRRSPALQLLQLVRDEVHRFGITYHRKLRSKRNFQSILDHVEGIGPKRRNALWKAFPSLDAMKQASPEDLAAVEGMNKRSAQAVYDFLRMEKHEKQQALQEAGEAPSKHP